MTADIAFGVDGHVATITLNRPAKLNAVTPEMAEAIVAHVKACNENDAIRCVIVTGAGERAFCAGSDIRELNSYDTPWNFRNRPDYCDAIRALRKPSIAAVNGYALGGGLETAMSCDIRIASANAQFAAPEIKLGWIGGGEWRFLAHSHRAVQRRTDDHDRDPIPVRRRSPGVDQRDCAAGGAARSRP